MTAISDARVAVLRRDGHQCVAPRLDPTAGCCYDKWGNLSGLSLEVDRVPFEAGSRMARHELPDTMVTLCPGHHRGTGPNRGYVWATSHRPLLREYLRGIEQRDGERAG